MQAARSHAGPSRSGRPRAALRPPRRRSCACVQPDLGARDGRRCFGPGGPHVRQALGGADGIRRRVGGVRRLVSPLARNATGPRKTVRGGGRRGRMRSACGGRTDRSAAVGRPVPSIRIRDAYARTLTCLPVVRFASAPNRLITLSFASRRRASRDDRRNGTYGASGPTILNIVRHPGTDPARGILDRRHEGSAVPPSPLTAGEDESRRDLHREATGGAGDSSGVPARPVCVSSFSRAGRQPAAPTGRAVAADIGGSIAAPFGPSRTGDSASRETRV